MNNQIVQWFEQNPLVGILGTIIGLILTVWGIIIAISSRTRKGLSFSLTELNLIKDFSDKFHGLTVLFKDEKLKNFSVTKVAIWNSGNVTINKSDIVQADPLRIEIADSSSILDYKIIQSNESSNQFELITTTDNTINKQFDVTFDYIDPQQGCVIQIFHNSSKPDQLKIKGKIKGVVNLKLVYKYAKDPIRFNKKRNSKIRFMLGYFCLIAPIAYLIYSWFFNSYANATIRNTTKIMSLIIAIPYLFLSYKFLVKRAPKTLNLFFESE